LEIDTPHTKCLSIRAIEDQSPVAAATSTVLYSLQYGDGGEYGDDLADDSIELPSGKADCDDDYVDEDYDYILGGLIFSDDEDFLVDVDSESEDERLRSSFFTEGVNVWGMRVLDLYGGDISMLISCQV